jgi:hypothetical protein
MEGTVIVNGLGAREEFSSEPRFLEGPSWGVYRISVFINLMLIGGLLFLFGIGLVVTQEIGLVAALGVIAAGAALKYLAWRRAARLLRDDGIATTVH